MSKTASQRRWLRRAQNRDYFQGPEQTRRVKQWRESNPGYWKKKPTVPPETPAEKSHIDDQVQKSCNVPKVLAEPLQDVCLARSPLFVGLISVIAGSTLQEDIAATINELLFRGQKILGHGASGSTSSKTE